MNTQQVIELLTNSNVLRTCIYIAGFIITGWRVGEFIKLQRHHEDTQREINRQNVLVQIAKATLEQLSVKDMTNEDRKKLIKNFTDCLDELKPTQQRQTSSGRPSNSGNTNEEQNDDT